MEKFTTNYYSQMNYQHFPQRTYYNPSLTSKPNNPISNNSTHSNRFVYVKQNVVNPNPIPFTSKVLVNPHFKKKVYVNPQFQISSTTLSTQPSKPKIHVNPNFVNNNNIVPIIKPVEVKITKPESRTVISTRTKIVRVPQQASSSPKQKIIVRNRRNSLHSKYKIVRSTKNQFKLDKRPTSRKSIELKPTKTIKKKYVYVNRFLSMSVVAKSVLLKQNTILKKPGFVNINGILYKKSPNSLKKAAETSANKSISKYKLVKKVNKQPSSSDARKSLVKRYKLIRSRKVSVSKMRKSNIPCTIFRRTGKCKGKDNGTCIKIHNTNQIILCTRFLQGACLNENCLLSHKVSHEKMPTCKYFLDGLCSKDGCPYLHVKISPKAEICRDFLEGFCKNGSKCDKRHQFLCPVYEKTKSCPKRRCPYPHGNLVRDPKVLKAFAKKCSLKKSSKQTTKKKLSKSNQNVQKTDLVQVQEVVQNRYYKDSDSKLTEDEHRGVINTISKDRPKLGTLPAFIPFNEST